MFVAMYHCVYIYIYVYVFMCLFYFFSQSVSLFQVIQLFACLCVSLLPSLTADSSICVIAQQAALGLQVSQKAWIIANKVLSRRQSSKS